MGSGYSSDYQAWLKVADTALPRNIFGYLLQVCLSPLRSDPFATVPFDDPKEIAKCGPDVGSKSFLPGSLPEREGRRPEMCKFMAPHRQVTQLTGDDMHKVGFGGVINRQSLMVSASCPINSRIGDQVSSNICCGQNIRFGEIR